MALKIPPGGQVRAQHSDGYFYPATLLKSNPDGSHDVRWHDGAEQSRVKAVRGVLPVNISTVKVGASIEAEFEGEAWPAIVLDVAGSMHVRVRWMDGYDTAWIPFADIHAVYAERIFEPPSPFILARQGSNEDKLRYIADCWDAFNRDKFDDRMHRPHFELMRNVAINKFRGRGYWQPRRRILGLNPRLFNADEAVFLEVELHEMCHQAVWEIDRLTYQEANGGHGPHWEAWMRRVGLNPLRYDPRDNSDYMTADEKNEQQQRVATRESVLDAAKAMPYGVEALKAWASAAGRGDRSAWPLPIQYYNQGALHFGVVVLPDKKNGYWSILDENSKTANGFTVVTAPAANIFKASASQLQGYNPEPWKEQALRLLQIKKANAEHNAWMRQMKKTHRIMKMADGSLVAIPKRS